VNRTSPPNRLLLAAAVFAASLCLYTATLAPGLLWGGGDFSTYQTYAYLGHIEDTDVGIFGHLLWVLLAHPFTKLPLHDVAWRANFASAVFAAAGLSFLFLSAYELTRSRVASLLATAALGVSHTFWTYAVMPKVYSLDALLLALCTYLLLRWRKTTRLTYLCLFALLYGLSFLNHLVMATAAAGFAIFIGLTLHSQRRSGKIVPALLLGGLSFCLGIAPYLTLVCHNQSGQHVLETTTSFIKGTLHPFANPAAFLTGLGWGSLLAIYQFPITILAGFVGAVYLWQRDRDVGAFVTFAVLGPVAFLFAATDPSAGGVYVWNLHYYLQAYVVFALAIAVGLEAVWERWCHGDRRREVLVIALTLLLPVLVYAAAPPIAGVVWQNVPDFRPLPGRDNLSYVMSPWKHQETGARDFGERILAALPQDSVLFADYSIWSVIHYLQVVEGARPDVKAVNLTAAESQVLRILSYAPARQLYLADTYRYYDLQEIQEHFNIVPAGPIYRLVPKDTSG